MTQSLLLEAFKKGVNLVCMVDQTNKFWVMFQLPCSIDDCSIDDAGMMIDD